MVEEIVIPRRGALSAPSYEISTETIDRLDGWGETIDRAELGMVGDEGAGGAPLLGWGLAFYAGGFGGAGL